MDVWFPWIISHSLWIGGLFGPRNELSLSPSPVLFAMKEDNEKVPTLLTDYILKGKSSQALWAQKQSSGAPPPQDSCWRCYTHCAAFQCPHQTRPGRARESKWTMVRPWQSWGFAFECCWDAWEGDSVTPKSPEWLYMRRSQTNKRLIVKVLWS